MKPDIFTLSVSDGPDVQRWVDAIEYDYDAGLIPQWIGAIIISVRPDGLAQITCIERQKYVLMKLNERIGLN